MEAVEQLVIEHASWLMRLANLLCSNPCDASDLASETVYRLLKYGDRYSADRDFKPWAKSVMTNLYITEYNRRKCVPFCGLDDECCQRPGVTRTESLTSMRVMLSVIRRCARRSVAVECVLLYAKGYDYDEIGSIVGIPVGTVKSRISNGRKMLRTALEV
jgi:RNA polymerase sigma-70 factor (ECF subfamily)